MELFGVGIGEVLFVLILALILLGPQGMVKAGYKLGSGIRKLLRSPIWAMMLDTTRELRDMPSRLVRDAGLIEEVEKFNREAEKTRKSILSDVDLDEAPGETVNPSGSVPAKRTIAPPSNAYPQVYPDQETPAEVASDSEQPDPPAK